MSMRRWQLFRRVKVETASSPPGGSITDNNEQVSSTASSSATVSAEVAGALAEAASIRAGISRHRVRGILPPLEKHLPGLLDPERKTLVWGATSVDNMGKMGDRS
jgi:cytochrome c oxidase assembly factor 3